MDKNHRRQRRKADQARRTITRARKAAAALAASGAIAAGTQAYASPIRFDNPPEGQPGHYHWPTSGADEWLDITLPAGSQVNSYSPGRVSQSQYRVPHIDIKLNGIYSASLENSTGISGLPNYLLLPHNAGDSIPSGALWSHVFYNPAFVSWTGGPVPLLPIGESSYLGVRFDNGDGLRYGWIGVVLQPESYALEAFAWGYESEVGIPVAAGAPEPGSLALLALGCGGVVARRRRTRVG